MSFHRAASLCIALLLTLSFGSSGLRAQTTTATLTGRIADSGGTGIPGVTVSIRSAKQPSGNKEVLTDVEGNYKAPLLPPADDYMVIVDYPGFGRVEVGPLDLDRGKRTVQNVTLRTDDELVDIVRVDASGGTAVDPDSGETRSSYNEEFLVGLPVIGHRFQDFLVLAPGVTDTDGDGNPNVHGGRQTGLQIRLDGANITDPVTGTFGQNVNPDIIEELDLVTAGANAEFGRAEGAFANIITKSGGNDFEGKFSVFWQGKFLNGNGANNNDVNRFDNEFPNYSDVRPTLTLGGAIVRDRIWYFGSVEILDTQRPVNQIGADILVTSRGNNSFGKVTWQVNPYHKLALQVSSDPLTIRGQGLALGVSPDSDFEFAQGGTVPQLKWTATLSPALLLEASVSHFDSGIAVTPVSRFFRPQETHLIRDPDRTAGTIQAVYPCSVVNCDPALGEKRTFQQDVLTGRINGPFSFRNDDSRIRNAVRTDLSYNLDDAWGQHNIKSGIEFADESFADEPVNNPVLIDATEPFEPDPDAGTAPRTDTVQGVQLLLVSNPLVTPQRAASFNSSAFLQDSWKPRSNLTVNVGLRIDREDIDTSGFDFFDPRAERRKSIALWKSVCQAARDQGDISLGNSNCRSSDTYDGLPPYGLGNSLRAAGAPPEIAALDVDGSGFVDVETGADREALFQHFTGYSNRETSNFEIVNNNLAPRFSISWDPWADGKTRVFGNWSRFYDRLFLATVTSEIGPDTLGFAFQPDVVSHRIEPGSISEAASTVSIGQVDRGLRTPYTDEFSLGFERELAPEWSASVTYIRRRSIDLLQDVDVNHFTCPQAGQVIGVGAQQVCERETDRFGEVTTLAGGRVGGDFAFDIRAVSHPNDAPDLYTVSSGFNQVLRVGNFNSARFEAYELKVVKRLHRSWQMQASYTWSKAFGQAEVFGSPLGNDPETTDDEEGYLAFDQRHVLKFQAVTRLTHGITLGSVVQWASGTPYSVIRTVLDRDSTGNTIFRTFFPSGQRNDQRNVGFWKMDGRLEKTFTVGKIQASAFLSAENLLNTDSLAIAGYNLEAFNGVGLNAARDAGRRFEIGASLIF